MKAGRLTFAAALGVAILGAFGAPAAVAAEGYALKEVAGTKFPERSFVLTLPDRRVLGPNDVGIAEDGKGLPGVKVVPAGETRGFQTILAIDASDSIRNGAIDRAMEAARAFAAQRKERQALGVVFFGGEVRLALKPTTDVAAIDAALAKSPPLTRGTRLHDAAHLSVRALDASGASAGAVVVISDGADVGSQRSLAEATSAARKAGVRLFGVGLQSVSFDPATLRALADGGDGTYAEAVIASDLKGIFEALAQRLAGEYILTYRSQAALGSVVTVDATVEGVPGFARITYQAPPLGFDGGESSAKETWWTTNGALMVVVLLITLMLGVAVYLALRPRPVSVADRIDKFVVPRKSTARLTGIDARQAMSFLAGAEKSLGRNRRWSRFAEDVDVGRLDQSPVALAAAAALATFFVTWLLAVPMQRPLAAVVLLLAIPFGVRKVIAIKAERTRRLFADQLVDNLQVIVSAMRAGHSFTGALSVAVEDASEPARSELRRVVQDEQLGVEVEEALFDVARRMRNEELEHVGLVAALQRNTGGNTAEVVERLIDSIRHRTDLRRLVKTLTAQGRISGAVVTALPIGLTVIMNVVSPGFSDPMLDSSVGRIALIMTAGMIGLGWIIIRKVVDIKV